jgi:hypothetical protein
MAPPKLVIDRRLVGTWKSDRRRTFKNFYFKPGADLKAIRKLKSIFGKLVIRWGYRKIVSELDGSVWEDEYEVVAKDASSVVVRVRQTDPQWEKIPQTELLPREYLKQIHFDGEHFWIGTPFGHLSEYFKRVK